MTGKQGSIDQVVTTGYRRYADMRSPRIATALYNIVIRSNRQVDELFVQQYPIRCISHSIDQQTGLDQILPCLSFCSLSLQLRRASATHLSVQAEQGVIGLTSGIKSWALHAVVMKQRIPTKCPIFPASFKTSLFPSLLLVQDNIRSFKEKAHETYKQPEVVIYDSLARPESGTQANPILIADDLAPLGLASNPIVIQVNEGQCRDNSDQRSSDADTVIIATPDFWEALTGRNFADPVKDNASIDSSSIYIPTGLLVYENLDSLQPFDISTSNRFALDHKTFGVTENSFDTSFQAIKRASVATDHGGTVN